MATWPAFNVVYGTVTVQRPKDLPEPMETVLFVGTEKGAFLMRSQDRTRWAIEGPLFKGWKVTAAARAPDGRFVAASASHVYGPMLHVSDNLQTWQAVADGPRYLDGRKLQQIWTVVPVAGGMYAGVAEAGLFFTNDPMGPWQPVPGLNDHPTRVAWQPGLGGLCAHVLLHNPRNTDQLWCGISAVGVFRSDDAGETWQPKNRGIPVAIEDKEHKEIGFCVHGLALDPHNPAILYRQDHLGMFRSTDGGDTWHDNSAGLPANFGFPIVTDPTTGTVYAYPLQSDEYRLPPGGAMAVYRSRDQGLTWTACREGLMQKGAWTTVLRGALSVDGQSPCGVYLGTTSGTVHYSIDGGDTWQHQHVLLPRILCVEVFTIRE